MDTKMEDTTVVPAAAYGGELNEYAVLWEPRHPGDAIMGKAVDVIELWEGSEPTLYLCLRAGRLVVPDFGVWDGALRAVHLSPERFRGALKDKDPAVGDYITIIYHGGESRGMGGDPHYHIKCDTHLEPHDGRAGEEWGEDDLERRPLL